MESMKYFTWNGPRTSMRKVNESGAGVNSMQGEHVSFIREGRSGEHLAEDDPAV